MKLGFIGLGRMGREMVLHLLEDGVDVVVYNRTAGKISELGKEYDQLRIKNHESRVKGIKTVIHDSNPLIHNLGKLEGAYKVAELVQRLETPRVIWLMVEHGKPVDEVIKSLLTSGVIRGDIIIDGGNSFYKDSVRRYKDLKEKGINFLDVGTSGGLEGARHGACLMIGGDRSTCNEVQPLFRALAGSTGGYAYFGPAGAGHFVKMVHNGVEYGMLQAIGEGFEILEKGPYKLDLEKVANNWRQGSVVRGWLMELMEKAFKNDPRLETIEGIIGGGSTGEWTVSTAKELGAEVSVIEKSLEARKKSLAKPSFSGKVVASLRREFGGHEVKKVKS